MSGAGHPEIIVADPCLRNYLRRIVGSSDRVDDVLQSVAERLLRDPKPIEEPQRYLRRASRNAAIDQLRETERRDRRESEYAELNDATPVSVEAAVETAQKIEVLNRAVRELPLLTQSMFLAYHVLGASQQSIAAQHGVHVSTVEKRLAKAKRHCYSRLADLLD